jgi:hypothetical protein
MTTNTEPKLKEELEKGLSEASDDSPEKGPKITISLGEDIEFVCETKPDKSPDKGKTIVAYTAYKEERGLFWFLCGNEVYTDSFFDKIVLKVLPDKHFTIP